MENKTHLQSTPVHMRRGYSCFKQDVRCLLAKDKPLEQCDYQPDNCQYRETWREERFSGKIGYGIVKRRHRLELWIPKNLLALWIEYGDYHVNCVLSSNIFMAFADKYFEVEFSNDVARGASSKINSSCQTEVKANWLMQIAQKWLKRIKEWKESAGGN